MKQRKPSPVLVEVLHLLDDVGAHARTRLRESAQKDETLRCQIRESFLADHTSLILCLV